MKIDKGKAQFSMHAMKRAQTYDLTVRQLMTAWYQSSYYTLPKKMEAYKFSVYGLSSLDDFYMYYPEMDLLFTCHKMNEEMTVIITVTRRKEANNSN